MRISRDIRAIWQRDCALTGKRGNADLIYAPEADEIYPEGFATRIVMDGPAGGWRAISGRIFSPASRPWWPNCSCNAARFRDVRRKGLSADCWSCGGLCEDLDLGVEIVGVADGARSRRAGAVFAQRLSEPGTAASCREAQSRARFCRGARQGRRFPFRRPKPKARRG